MAGNISEISDSEFTREVIESATPVLVDFWATWCGPCRAMEPALKELATQYQGQVKIVKINADDNTESAQNLGVRALPTLFLFKGGKVVEQIVGAVPKGKLEESFRKVL